MRAIAALVIAIGVSSLFGAQEVRASREATRDPWLLFDSSRTGRSEIYAVSEFGVLRQLTFRGGTAPRPSPNGRYVLFDRGGSTWIMAADGRHERLLVRGGTQASWAPDSRRIAYVRAAGGIWSVNRDGSGKQALTTDAADREPRWSPNGRTLALIGRDGLAVIRNGRRLILANDAAPEFSWSPDSRTLAFRTGSRLALVDANGGPVRTFTWVVGHSESAPAWSPKGNLIAFADGEVLVVTVASGGLDAAGPTAFAPSEVAWAPRGNTIAFVDQHVEIDLARIGRTDAPTVLRTEHAPEAQPFGIAWTTPPAGVRYRKPAPAPPPIVASGFELKSNTPIDELAADGMRLAFRSCSKIGSWTPGKNSVSNVLSQWPVCIGTPIGPWGDDPDVYGFCCLVVAGDTVGYEWSSGGIEVTTTLELTSPHASTSIGCASGMLGHGQVVVFATDLSFGCFSDARGQVWRVPLPLSNACTWDPATGTLGSPCRELTPGPALPLAVDDTRVVVRRLFGLDGSIVVLDTDGVELFSIPFAPSTALTARVAGADLVVLVAGEFRDYDATTGALLHAWPAAPGASLQDTAGGLAAYIVDGTLHLLRLRDGADAVVGAATAVRLEDTGLFYAYTAAAPYPGRIRFVPFEKLPLH